MLDPSQPLLPDTSAGVIEDVLGRCTVSTSSPLEAGAELAREVRMLCRTGQFSGPTAGYDGVHSCRAKIMPL